MCRVLCTMILSITFVLTSTFVGSIEIAKTITGFHYYILNYGFKDTLNLTYQIQIHTIQKKLALNPDMT